MKQQKETNILLIEDCEAQKDLMCDFFEFENSFNIDWAEDLDEAFNKIDTNSNYDVVLLDLSLPGSRGLETLELAKEKIHLPIIVLTGLDNENLALETIKAGAQDYFVKDKFSFDFLTKSIKFSIERFQLLNTLEHYMEELERSNKELESFAYIASHDLQEPLRKVCVFGDRLQEKFSKALPDQAQDYIQRMQKSTGRMQKLLDDLLQYSRTSSQEIEIQEISLNKVLNDVINDISPKISESNAQININIDNDTDLIEADEIQIYRLFENLISNSIKYQEKGSQPIINISSKHDRKYNSISITDNGIGFKQEYAERIFQQFQRLHGKSEYEGTGIGLAIVKKIIERHQGKIAAQSKLGKGSTFTVSLPQKNNTSLSMTP